MAPGAGDGHDVVVGVEVDRLPRAGGRELAEDVEARIGVLLGREGLFQQRARDGEAPGAQAEGLEFVGQPGGDFGVVLARRIDGGEAHQLLQAAQELGGVAVNVVGRCHGPETLRAGRVRGTENVPSPRPKISVTRRFFPV